jgi:hypothetical protein
MATKRWQDWGNLALGLWLFVSPWELKFFQDLGPRSLDFYVAGAVIALLAVLALRRRTLWGEWLTFILGLWMIGSPWLLGFSSNRPAVPDCIAAGALVALLSVWVILRYTPLPEES